MECQHFELHRYGRVSFLVIGIERSDRTEKRIEQDNMDNHEEGASLIPGDRGPTQNGDQDAAIFAVSAESKTDLEHDETSHLKVCLPGSRHPTQCIYTVGVGNKTRRVWSLSDQLTMYLNDLKDSKDWEKQMRFWNSHIDFESVEDITPRKAFGSECGEEDYPAKYPPTAYPISAYPPSELLREWHRRNRELPEGSQSETDIQEPRSPHTEDFDEDESRRGTGLNPEIDEVATSTSEAIIDDENRGESGTGTSIEPDINEVAASNFETADGKEAVYLGHADTGIPESLTAHIDNDNGDKSRKQKGPETDIKGTTTSMPEAIVDNKAITNGLLDNEDGVPTIEDTIPSTESAIWHSREDRIGTGKALASELEQAHSPKSEESPETHSESPLNMTGTTAGEDNNMEGSETYLTTFNQPQPPQLDGTTTVDQEEEGDGTENQESRSKRKRSKKNKSTSEAAVQPVEIDGPWAFGQFISFQALISHNLTSFSWFSPTLALLVLLIIVSMINSLDNGNKNGDG